MSSENNANTDTYFMSASEIASATQQYTSSLQSSLEGLNGVVGEVDSFINGSSAELQGAAWDNVRAHIGEYRDTIDSLRSLNNQIDSEMESALKIVQDFLEPDTDLNTADLPKFEAEKIRLETEIKNLEADNATLSQVPSEVCSGYDEYGHLSCSPNEPAYTNAQNQIAENNRRIRDELTPQLNETIRLINKINQFVNEILPKVNAKLEELYGKVMEFSQKVNDLMTTLPDGSSIREKYEQETSSYDLSTPEGRFLKIYDLLTQKYGYSEWGAKAILASMHGTNSKFLPDRFKGDNGPNAGYGLCQWEYLKYGGYTDHAQQMENWCKANGWDYRTIDGQVAWLDHFLPIISEGYHTDLAQILKTGGEDRYWEMASKFGTYHQGTQGDPNKNYYRAYDGDLWSKYFSLIDKRASMKTSGNVDISKPPTFQMSLPDTSTSTGTSATEKPKDENPGKGKSGSWSGGSYQSTGVDSQEMSNKKSSSSYSDGGYSGGSNVDRVPLSTQNTQEPAMMQALTYGDVLPESTPAATVASASYGAGRGGGTYTRPYTDSDMVPVGLEVEPEMVQPVELKAEPVVVETAEPVKEPTIGFVENKPQTDLGPQPGEKLVEMSVTELTKGTPEEAIRNPIATAAVAALAVGAAGAATVATLKHDEEDIDEDKIEGISVKDYY